MKKSLLFPDLETSPCLTGSDNCSCFEMIWQTGHLIDRKQFNLNNLEFICETLPNDKLSDFAVTDLGAPIVSDRVKKILDDHLVDNIEYFPARIITRAGATPINNYFMMNILGLLDCIDFESSDLEVEEEDGEVVDIDSVNELILKDKSYGSIYRMYFFERVIVLEEPLRQALSSANITGMKIVSPEMWDGFAGEK